MTIPCAGPAALADILGVQSIGLCTPLSSRKRALEECARLLALGAPSVAAADIHASLCAREKLGCVAPGSGIAIPHGRVAGIRTAVAAFLRPKHAVDYEASDGQPVDLIFGLIVPQHASDEQCGLLKHIAARLADAELCQALRAAPDAAAVLALLTR